MEAHMKQTLGMPGKGREGGGNPALPCCSSAGSLPNSSQIGYKSQCGWEER